MNFSVIQQIQVSKCFKEDCKNDSYIGSTGQYKYCVECLNKFNSLTDDEKYSDDNNLPIALDLVEHTPEINKKCSTRGCKNKGLNGFNTCKECSIKMTKNCFELVKKKSDMKTFEDLKNKFEKNHFMVKGVVWRKEGNDKFHPFTKKGDLIDEYANWKYQEVNNKGDIEEKKFLPKWGESENRKGYERFDFIPNVSECPSNVYNFFEGFEIEKIYKEMNKEEIEKYSKPILDHMNHITSGYGSTLCEQFARIVQKPGEKSNIATLIRDMNTLFSFGGGTGKNLIMDFFGNKIIGEKYYKVVSDNSELYNAFNGQFAHKLIIFVEEAAGRDNFKNSDKIKSGITKQKIEINNKGQNQFNIKDLSNWFFTTNERNAVPIKFGDRRWQVFDSSKEKKGDDEYFKDLIKSMNDPNVQVAFYHHLKNLKITESGDASNIIKTGAYLDIIRCNAPVIMRWLCDTNVLKYIKESRTSTELYSNYSIWAKNYCESNEEHILSHSKFSRELMNEGSVFVNKGRDSSGIKIEINREKLVEKLKSIDMLESDFNLESIDDKETDDKPKTKTAKDYIK